MRWPNSRLISNICCVACIAVLSLNSFSVAQAQYSQQEQIRLKVWCWDNNFNVPAATMAAERFMAKHPNVIIDIESIEQRDLYARAISSLKAENYQAIPDIVLIEDYDILTVRERFPNFLRSLGSIDFEHNFVPAKVKASFYKEQHYGVPFDSGVASTYIREDLFKQAGYNLQDLQGLTWDEFIDIGKEVKTKTNTALFAIDILDLELIRLMLQSASTWYTDQNGRINLQGNPYFKEALRICKRIYDEKLAVPTKSWNGYLQNIYANKVSAAISGPYLIVNLLKNSNIFEKSTSELSKDMQEQYGKWKIIPLPKLMKSEQDSITHYANLGGSQWCVNNYQKHADIAEQFLKESFVEDVELLKELVPKIGLLSSHLDIEHEKHNSLASGFFGGQKIYPLLLSYAQKTPAISYGSNTHLIEEVITSELDRVFAGEDLDTIIADMQIKAEMECMP